MLSAIIPVIDEAVLLPGLIAALRPEVDEIVVVDGGSRDASIRIASQAGARVVTATAGRGAQLNAGVAASAGRLLWFVHADSQFQPGIGAAIRKTSAFNNWGCCRVQIAAADWRLKMVAFFMNQRARKGGSCTGDMGIWARRRFFEQIGGFPEWPTFEDLDFSDRARAIAPAAFLETPLITSARRWQTHGYNRTIAKMWALRAGYRVGISPMQLSQWYK